MSAREKVGRSRSVPKNQFLADFYYYNSPVRVVSLFSLFLHMRKLRLSILCQGHVAVVLARIVYIMLQ